MITLGIDAATSSTGFAVVDVNKNSKLVMIERFRRPSTMVIGLRIHEMKERALELVEEYHPDLIVVEHLRFSKYARNLDAMVKVAWAMGAVIAAVSTLDAPLFTLPANSVRKVFAVRNKEGLRKFCNHRFREDLDRLGYPKGLLAAHEDISDAIGLAMAGTVKYNSDNDDS